MKKGMKGLILAAIMVLLVVGYYAYLSNKTADNTEEVILLTATQEVLSRDLQRNYPPSPKEVLKYYSELTMSFYNEEHDEEDVIALARKARELYDAELLAKQTEEQYIHMLSEDIEEYKKEQKTISSYSTSSSVDVEYYTRDSYEWAKLSCIYTLRQETTLASTQEDFLLRKDTEGHWKIYGWIVTPTEGKSE